MEGSGISIGGFDSAEWKEFNEEMKRTRAIREKADSACAETICTMNNAISSLRTALEDDINAKDRYLIVDDLRKMLDSMSRLAESMAQIRSAMNDPKPGIGFGGIV